MSFRKPFLIAALLGCLLTMSQFQVASALISYNTILSSRKSSFPNLAPAATSVGKATFYNLAGSTIDDSEGWTIKIGRLSNTTFAMR